jgi:hypothetical protein
MRFVFFAAIFLAAGRLSVAATAQPGWLEVKNSEGEIKATIEAVSITRESSFAHARVCLIENGACLSGHAPSWSFNCSNRSYSWIDMTVVPPVAHDMLKAEPGSIEDQLLAIACKQPK